MLHRDLSQYKEGVYSKVVIYKDRIEFRNVGSLYGEYPELYPEKISSNKKIQDKKVQRTNIILEICKEPKSIKEILKELDYKSMPTLKREYIKPLLKQGKLKMTIQDKPTSRNQKYISMKK